MKLRQKLIVKIEEYSYRKRKSVSNLIDLLEDVLQCGAFVKTVMSIRLPQRTKDFLFTNRMVLKCNIF
jgi:hypothetical protein